MALSLHTLCANVSHFDTAVVYTDNAHCVDYIGDSTRSGISPSSDDGKILDPLIMYVREQFLYLDSLGKHILVKKLPRKQNVTDCIAKACMRNERDQGWPTRIHIPRIDVVPGLMERIQKVAENTKNLEHSRISYTYGEIVVYAAPLDSESIQSEHSNDECVAYPCID